MSGRAGCICREKIGEFMEDYVKQVQLWYHSSKATIDKVTEIDEDNDPAYSYNSMSKVM